MYELLPIYKRRSNPSRSRLVKKLVLRPAGLSNFRQRRGPRDSCSTCPNAAFHNFSPKDACSQLKAPQVGSLS